MEGLKSLYAVALAGGALLSVAMTGCSIFDKSEKYVVKGSDGSVMHEREAVGSDTSEALSGPVLTPPKNTSVRENNRNNSGNKAVRNKNQKANSGAVSKSELASARRGAKDVATEESIVADSRRKVSPGKDGKIGNVPLSAEFSIDGEWTIYSVRGNLVTGEERPYITFDLSAKRFYGSNGCNIVNGDIVEGKTGAIELGNVISTMRMCEDAPFEYLINLAISDVKSYSARQEGSATFLDLKGKEGNVIMVLRRHNMDFLNGAWAIETLNGTAIGKYEATMTINITDLQIHGTTGCNLFNGELFIDPDKDDSMQFLNIATTRKGCPPDSRETEFLLALEMVETACSLGDDGIAMYDVDGNELFRMSRINIRPESE